MLCFFAVVGVLQCGALRCGQLGLHFFETNRPRLDLFIFKRAQSGHACCAQQNLRSVLCFATTTVHCVENGALWHSGVQGAHFLIIFSLHSGCNPRIRCKVRRAPVRTRMLLASRLRATREWCALRCRQLKLHF
jgi:hypothetical protein